MKPQRKVITYITPNSPGIECMGAINRLITEESIEFQIKNSLEELFPLMSDPKFKTDLILIDIEKLYNLNDLNLFDVINTLSTLIKCTVHRSKPGKPEKRQTHIAVYAGNKANISLIKDVLSMPEIKGICPDASQVGFDEVKLAIMELTEGKTHVPKLIQRIRNKQSAPTKDGILLTPRQRQIMQIISERGASNKVIARMLNISESTVKLHIGAILKKYGVRNRTQLAIFSNKST